MNTEEIFRLYTIPVGSHAIFATKDLLLYRNPDINAGEYACYYFAVSKSAMAKMECVWNNAFMFQQFLKTIDFAGLVLDDSYNREKKMTFILHGAVPIDWICQLHTIDLFITMDLMKGGTK